MHLENLQIKPIVWFKSEWGKRILLLLGWVIVFGVAYFLMLLLPTPGADFHPPDVPFIDYPPWITILVWPIRSIAIANALTLTVLAFALRQYNAKPIHYLLAFTSLPLYANLWLSQYESIPLLGIVTLPWGLPLAITKPQVALWGVAAWWLRQSNRWKIAVLCVGGAILSFGVYGWWPARLQSPTTLNTFYNLSAWYWGGILGGLVAVAFALYIAFKTRDVDQAMALGALATPYIQYHSYIMLLPALARLSGWRLLIVWLVSWAGLLALSINDTMRGAALLFPLTLWITLHWNEARA